MSLRGGTALDIGANQGIYCYWLSRFVGRSGRVVAFEPQPELKDRIEQVGRWFTPEGVLDLRMAGLSDVVATAQLSRRGVGDGSASLEWVPGQEDSGGRIEVPTLTLDSIRTTFPRPVKVIKCDVEGHEASVFAGAQQLLTEDMPPIVVEIHHQQVERVRACLEPLGYVGVFFDGKQEVPIEAYAQRPCRKPGEEHRNYLFAPA
ncbi:MAG: FkbM family methyltransferase [Phycisphaerales bacterium]|nr:FkbM family methyltransferase [Phycisphaerales bacterium]